MTDHAALVAEARERVRYLISAYTPVDGSDTAKDIDLIDRLASRLRDVEAEREWRPIESAPKDGTPIVGLCQHDADPYFLEDGRRLTTYGAHVEGLGRVEDGPHIIAWGGEYDCDDGYIPNWWFRTNTDWEQAANPVAWHSLPAPPASKKEDQA